MRDRSIGVVLLLLLLPFLLASCGGGGGGGGGLAAVFEQEPNDDPVDAPDLGVPRRFEGRGTISATASVFGLADGDLDLFGFTAGESGTLRVVLLLPTDSDFDLALKDETGARLATARRDNLDPAEQGREILLTEVRAGRYYFLEVGGFGGAPGNYTFLFELLVDSHAGPVTPGSVKTQTVGLMDTARCFHAAARLPDGGVIVAGGTTEATSSFAAFLGALSTTELFTPGPDRFEPGPGLGSTRFGLTATRLTDGRVLLAGGAGAGTAALYDGERGEMMSTSLPLADGDRFLHTATLLPCGRVLLAGGVRMVFLPSPGTETLATSEIFDPKSLSFTAGPALLAGRNSHAACRLADGRTLLAGGVGRFDSEIVDLRAGAGSTAPGPDLNTIRDDHSATLLDDGRVLVAGGQDGTGASLDTVEILDDPADAAFRALPARMGSPRADHQALLLPGGQVLILGGEDDPGNNDDTILDTVDLFDPGDESLTPLPPLSVPRDDHRVVRLADGRLLVTGGEDAASLSIRDAEAYDPR